MPTPTNNADAPRRRNPLGNAVRVLVALALVLVLLVVCAPWIASKLGRGIVERALNESIAGKFTLSSLALSWTGPQGLGGVTLDDPQGGRVFEADVSADTGLWGLVAGGLNFGTVNVKFKADVKQVDSPSGTGKTTNLAEALRSSAPGVPPTPSPGAPTPTLPAAALRLPKGLAATLKLAPSELKYTGEVTPGSGARTVGLTGITADVTLGVGRPLSLHASASTLDGQRALTIDVTADHLSQADGLLTLDRATADARIDGAIPAEFLELLAAVGGAKQPGTIAPAGDEPARVAAHVVLKDDRLRLADPSRPAFVEFRVPSAAFALAPGQSTALKVDKRPKISLLIESLDVPVPSSAGHAPDYRGARVTGLLRATELSGAVTAGNDGAGKAVPFSVKPFELKVGSRDFAEGVGVIGQVEAMYAGRDAGKIIIDASATELLDSAGAFRASGPGLLRGKLIIEDVPTPILQPLADAYDLDLGQALGPTLKAEFRAGLLAPGASPFPAAQGATAPTSSEAQPPYLSGVVVSEKTRVWLDLFLDADRVRSRNEGIKLECQAPGYLLRRFLHSDAPVRVTGEGLSLLTLEDFSLPGALGGASGPDLAHAKGRVRLVVGELGVKLEGAPADLTLDSLDSTIEIDGAQPPIVKLDHQFRYQGAPFALGADLSVPGLLKLDPSSPGGLKLAAADARPRGTLFMNKAPTAALTIIGEQAHRLARAALGDTLDVRLEAAPGDGGSSVITLAVESAGTRGGGSIVIDRGRLRTTDPGLTITLARPGEVLNTVLQSPGSGAKVSVDAADPLIVRLTGVDAALGDTGFDLPTLKAGVQVRASKLGVRLTSPGAGQAERVALDAMTADAVLDGAGGADLTIDAGGSFQSLPFSVAGTLGAGGVLGREGVDIRRLTPRGSLTLSHVPTSLLALVDPEQAALAQAAIGPSADVTIAALQGDRGVSLQLTSAGAVAQSRASVQADSLRIGPTRLQASLTPQAAETILALKAPTLSPRPAFARAARLTADATEISLAIKGPLEIDPRPIGQYKVGFRSEDDIVVNNAAMLGAGTPSSRPLNAGLRGLTGNLVANADPTRPGGELSAQVRFFDPAAPSADLGTLTINTGTTLPNDLNELTVEAPDLAAMDRWLGTPELLTLALGDRLDVRVLGEKVRQAGAVKLGAIVDSPRLNTRCALTMNEAGYRLEPTDATWTLEPKLAERYIFVDQSGKPTARLVRPVTMTLGIESLALGPPGRLLEPGRFGFEVRFAAPGLAIATPDGVETDMGQLTGRIGTPKGSPPGSVKFVLETPGVSLASARGAGTTKPFSIKGQADNLVDASGAPTPALAVLTAEVDGGLPTALLDALSGQGGALVDLLGARVDTRISTDKLGRDSGSLSASLKADNAQAGAKGTVRAGAFTASEPVEVRMTRITPEAGKRYVTSVLPILANLEKTGDDKPAVITATGLTAPLDGDLKKLNGDIVFDLGTVQFRSSDFFGEILKATSNASFGKVGQKIPPFKAKVREGVVEYEKFVVPTGEFDLVTKGKVDLVRRRMNITVWVPVFALTDELVGALRIGSLPGLRELSGLPIKFSGDLKDPDKSIDTEQLGKDILNVPAGAAGGAAGGVEDAIKGIGDLFKKKKK